ncbi:MAG: hypothetical protein MJZ50_02355 [Treponema sp.]|nr:hypothetical protein [Treponema sp.]
MDNDNKIESGNMHHIHDEIGLILKNELQKIAPYKKKVLFDFEREYAATRNNSSVFYWENMWKKLVICLAVVLLLTVMLMAFVSHANRNQVIEVKEFETLNLTSLLSKVGTIDDKIAENENQKKNLEVQRAEEIERIENKHVMALKALKALNIKNERTRESRRQLIEQEYNDDLLELEKYNKLIAACNDNIKLYTDQRQQFDSSRVQQAERQKAVINSERILHEKEKDKLVKKYEDLIADNRAEYKLNLEKERKRQEKVIAETVAAYDPKVPSDERLNRILRASKSMPASYKGLSQHGQYLTLNEETSQEFRNSLENLMSSLDNVAYLFSQYEQFPQKEDNAIVSLANAMLVTANSGGSDIAASSVMEINKAYEEKASMKKERDLVSGEYRAFLDSLCEEPIGKIVPDGIVTGAGEEFSYRVYFTGNALDSLGALRKAAELDCSVYRGIKKVAVGKIHLGDGMYSSLSQATGDIIRIGDRVVIEKQKASAK